MWKTLLVMIIYSLLILLPGWLILTIWFNEITKGFFKKTALAYGLGTILLTVEIFLTVFVFRWPINWLFFVLLIELAILGWQYFRRFGFNFKQHFKTEPKNITWVEVFLALAIVWQMTTVAVLAWLKPVANWDSLALWSFKAKTLFYHTPDFFASGSQWFWQSHAHPMYPWLVPLAQYWLAVLNKSFDEVAVNFIFVGFFVAIIFLFYGYLRNYLNRLLSLVFVFLLATVPLVSVHAYNAYADLSLAFYLAVAFILNYKWLESGNYKFLSLTGLFLAGAFFTKNEAIIFIIAHILILLIAKLSLKIKGKEIFFGLWPGLIIIFPWLGWRMFYKLPISNVAGDLSWHPEVFGQLVKDLLVAASWNIWYYIFLGLSLLFIKEIIKDKSLRLAYGLWCLALGGFLVIYLLTEEYQWAMDGTALSRTLINFIPGSIFLVALLFRREFFNRHHFFKD